MTSDPQHPQAIGPCPDPLAEVITVEQLAVRLGVRPGTVRQHLHAQVAWLPRPDGTINGGAVWRRTSLVGIEERKPGRGQRPARTTPAPAPAPAPAPVQDTADGFWIN